MTSADSLSALGFGAVAKYFGFGRCAVSRCWVGRLGLDLGGRFSSIPYQ